MYLLILNPDSWPFLSCLHGSELTSFLKPGYLYSNMNLLRAFQFIFLFKLLLNFAVIRVYTLRVYNQLVWGNKGFKTWVQLMHLQMRLETLENQHYICVVHYDPITVATKEKCSLRTDQLNFLIFKRKFTCEVKSIHQPPINRIVTWTLLNLIMDIYIA